MAQKPNEDMAAAVAAHQRGDHDTAQRLYGRVLQAAPSYGPALCYLGMSLTQQGKPGEALNPLGRAVELDPRSFEALAHYGLALAMSGDSPRALAVLDRALALEPRDVQVLLNRGNVLRALQRRPEAVETYRGALAIAPGYAELHNNLGNVLSEMGRYPEAVASYDQALAIDPNHIAALENRGNALTWGHRIDEGLATYSRALAIEPRSADVHYDIGCALLRRGDYRDGFREYEWRLKQRDGMRFERHFGRPAWRGETPLGGKTILLYAEQGYGDTLNFIRYVPMVAALGATVVLEVQPALKSLLATLDGAAAVIARGESLPPFDHHCPLLSLPLAFGTEVLTIPVAAPITAPAEHLSQWGERIPCNGRRVGLVWCGNPTFIHDHIRSMTLADIAPLLSTPDVTFVSLNPSIGDADAAALAAMPNVTHLGAVLRDFADTAAAISGLDLVVTTDTSAAHLAGVLGKPTWIMLSTRSDWRYLLDREDCPWYPTARLFRQPQFGDWASVVNRVASELRHF